MSGICELEFNSFKGLCRRVGGGRNGAGLGRLACTLKFRGVEVGWIPPQVQRRPP